MTLAAPDIDQPSRSDSPSTSPLRQRRRLTTGMALGIYAIAGLFADLPIYPGDANHVPTMRGEDIFQTVWFLRYTPFALAHGQNLFATHVINYPFGVDLAQNTGMPLLGLLTAPLTMWVSPIASMNLLRWLAFVLSAFAMYAVLRRFVSWAPAALIGGFMYGFSPYMITQGLVHLNLIFVPLPPVLIYLAYEVVVAQRKHPYRQGALLGLVGTAQYFISSEVLATTAIVAAIGTLYLGLFNIGQVRTHLGYGIRALASAAGLALPFLAYPVWAMSHLAAHYVGAAQGSTNVYNADLLGLVLPTREQLIAPAHLATIGSRFVGNNVQENGSYLGIPLLLITIYLLARYRRDRWNFFAALMAATAFVLSLGTTLVIHGRPHALPFPLPFKELAKLPIIDNVLAVRFSLYVAGFVTVIVVSGIDRLRTERVERRSPDAPTEAAHRSPAVVCGVGAALVAVASLLPNWPYQTLSPHLQPGETAAGLASVPNGAVVLTYPYSTSISDSPMLWQAMSGMRFSILGSYALTQGPRGSVWGFPAILQPSKVEAMFINSVIPVADPILPGFVATSSSITAATVAINRHRHGRPHFDHGDTVAGTVESVDRPNHRIVIEVNDRQSVSVLLGPNTSYTEPFHPRASFADVAATLSVVVTGQAGAGTVTSNEVQLLRRFIANNHVTAVVIGLGIRDSGEIAAWVERAIGPPSRSGDGVALWTHIDPRRWA